MSEAKTKPTDADVRAFIAEVESDTRRADAHRLVEMMSRITGEKPVMWGPSIVGFGRIRYTYPTGNSGEMSLTGFSPRKSEFSIYLIGQYAGVDGAKRDALLAKLGKHKMGKACLYVKKLEDIDVGVLEEMIAGSVATLKKLYPDG